jgi:hypothetical protein
MPSLPPLPGDSQLGVSMALSPQAGEVAGSHARRRAPGPVWWTGVAWLDPGVCTAQGRRPATTLLMPQRR